MAVVRDGASRALLVPVGSAWAELQGGWLKSAGAYVRAEAGFHPWQRVGVYSFGQITTADAAVGAGVRFEIP